ncbi:protein of unknown function [Taphrina deformans PYCC 5710]|uniref:Uncharacterized protein n=1 Tax=Taphrina deformans (strain PYCC 5710 / ATCC 11124 / CBS 356.35 / IMI 108563 / JCM 9778 / NBRC 8474) TaxID=1097556 RepID=R4XEF6_TAPDE|nr:protein of unknown function [Taphrina deformans PYCC 5710]|eukprot:CCG84222.1 protein of unknown function [Taphrina deformans PYCC 5710]
MVSQGALATRPIVTHECTCLWQELSTEDNRNLQVSLGEPVSAAFQHVGNSLKSALYSPINSAHERIPGGYPAAVEKSERLHTKALTTRTLFENNQDNSEVLLPALGSRNYTGTGNSRTQLVVPDHFYKTKDTDTKTQLRKSPLADRPIPDLLVRRIKKNIRKSSEHKLRELVSYKAELLNTLQTLVPQRIPIKSSTPDSRVTEDAKSDRRSDFGQTWLCDHCLTQLKTYLYYAPTSRSPYLYEHSVPAYLSLLDDAILAVKSDSDMERVTHHELNSILMAELSVVEWRLSLKLARFHRKTGYLGVFPMEVGPYANLEIKRALNKPEDGLLTIIWRRIKSIGG